MEATAVSVGKAVLDGAVDYAKSVLSEEIALQLGVEGDVAFITDELEMMQSFLMTADEEQDKNKVVLTWVKQVREVAYNVEDSLMDFFLHRDKRAPCRWWIPRTLWERRDIAKEVKELRSRVEDVSNRNLRYRLIKGSAGSKPAIAVEEEAKVAGVGAMLGGDETRRTAVEKQGNPMVDLCQLIINEDTDLRVIAVAAWGSSGKTSLIREAYEHQVVYQKFHCRAWVMLTSPFNPGEFFSSLLRQFYLYSREVGGKTIQGKLSGYDVLKELEKMDQSHVADQVSALLDKKRYLIVLDGLTTIVEWDWIKTYLPDKKNGSRIILSAQQVEVASLCLEQPYQVTELKQLSFDQSIYLFHNKVWPRSMNKEAMPSSPSGIQDETQLPQQMAVGLLGRRKTTVGISEDLVGRMDDKDYIINLIGQANNIYRCKVISVWGMGGLGKTTLVRSVYQSQSLGGWKRAWVTALRPFNCEAMLRNLVLQLHQKDIQKDIPRSIQQAIDEAVDKAFEKDIPKYIQKEIQEDIEKENKEDIDHGVINEYTQEAIQKYIQKEIQEDIKKENKEDIDHGIINEYIQKAIQKYNLKPLAAVNVKNQEKAIAAMGLQELIAKLADLVTQECLVVVDDLLSMEEWDSIKESLAKAGRVIVTTREKSIAMHCSREPKNIYNLQRLEDTAAFDLFKKKVFKDNTEKVDLRPDMIEQARLILQKCDGLPLAISTIGGFLATKPKTAIEWRRIHNRISSELEINPELRTIKTVLVRSYDGLPYHLKYCFLYLSVFPEDHKISRKHVIKRWVTEGYARDMHGMSAEEVGDKYFEELLDRSMILPGQDVNIYSGTIKSCQLHDLMRQICISKAREENLSFTLEDGCSLSSSQGTIRHLAISSTWSIDRQDVFGRVIDLSHVRSLTVFGEWVSFFISGKMRFLRVLDLQGTYGLEDHHLNQIGELIHLKYLSLRRCNRISKLPNSLSSLRNLQTLDIRSTRVRKLQPNITNLQELQFLRADSVIVPREIGKLNTLRTLAHVRIYEEVKGSIQGLTRLYQLRKLGVGEITETNSKHFWSAIDGLNHLRCLSVNWLTSPTYELDYSLGGSLLPPRSIETLKLFSRVVRLTQWINQLQNLSRLKLWCTELQQDDIQAIGKLPNLEILVMRKESFEGKVLVFKQGSFPNLVLLELDHIAYVPLVKFDDGTMPKLEKLGIVSWWALQELSGLRCLRKLKEIRLINHGGCREFMDNVEDQLTEHPTNPSLLRM